MLAVIIKVNSSFLTVAIRTRNVDCGLIRTYGLGRLVHHSAILVAYDDVHIINSGVAADVDVVAVGGDFWYYVWMTRMPIKPMIMKYYIFVVCKCWYATKHTCTNKDK